MANLLDKNKQHLFTEKQNNKSNSFIASVNKLVQKFEELLRIDNKFTADDVALLTQLAKNELDINIREVAHDLRKGSYNGFRKLDINLLTNFIDYEESMTDEEKQALWDNYDKQVYYEGVTVIFTDDTSKTKTFSALVADHHKLFDEFANWEEFKAKAVNTGFSITADTYLKNHELLRFYDINLDTSSGSDIRAITLKVAPRPDWDMPGVSSEFVGAKEATPTYAWMDTTSALVTMANRISEVLDAADYIEKVGDTFVEDMEAIKNRAVDAEEEAKVAATAANKSAVDAEASFNKQVTLNVKSTAIAFDASPSVIYAPSTNTLDFQLPRNAVGVVGLTGFSINTDNGHLTLNVRDSDDIERAYIDDATGKAVIVLK